MMILANCIKNYFQTSMNVNKSGIAKAK